MSKLVERMVMVFLVNPMAKEANEVVDVIWRKKSSDLGRQSEENGVCNGPIRGKWAQNI